MVFVLDTHWIKNWIEYASLAFLLEVKLPYEPVRRSVRGSVCPNILRGREVSHKKIPKLNIHRFAYCIDYFSWRNTQHLEIIIARMRLGH